MFVRGRIASLAFVLVAALVSGGSCASREEGTPVAAAPGGQQPGGGGKQLDEDEACERLRKAEESARKRLNCEPLNRAECPYYVRPAGTGCWTYDEAAVSHCEDALGGYEFCPDFAQMPCIITAQPLDPKSCPPLPGTGGGGEAGMTGTAGKAGSSSQAGRGGRGGAGGRSGAGGTAGASGESGNAGAGG